MKTRFIAIGDLHLAQGPRNSDRLDALYYVIEDALQSPDGITPAVVSAWLWPGDLDDARMSIDDRNELIHHTELMASVAPVIIVPGNHDLPGDLDFLGHLKTSWPIYVVTSSDVVTLTLAHRPDETPIHASIFCLPYPSKASIVAAGFSHDQISRVSSESFELIFMQAAQQLNAARVEGHVTGMIGHVTITGAVASTGQPQIGTELELDPAHLLRLGDCFKVFNHIHKHQRVGDAVYAGSLCRLDWGECEEKGYITIECDPVTGKDWRHHETFVPIPVPPMFHVEGVLTRDRFEWHVTKGPGGPKDVAPPSWTNCDVRVRASYASAERDVLEGAKERVEQLFSDARRFEFEPIAVSERVLRAPEVVQAQSFNDKLFAWAKLMNVEWSDQIVERVTQLQRARDADQVAANVETRLRGLLTMSHDAWCEHNAGTVLEVVKEDGTVQQFDVAPIDQSIFDEGRLF